MGVEANTTVIIEYNETPPPNPPYPPEPDFMQNLINWLNSLFSTPPVVYTGDAGQDTQDLKNNLTNFTAEQFQAHYNYPYLQNETNPPNCTDPSTIQSADNFVNCPSNDTNAITQYLSQTLIPNTSLPNVYWRQAVSDLSATIAAYTKGLTQGWQYTPYHRVYVDATGKISPYAIDGYLTFVNVKVVDYSKKTVQPPTPTLLLRFIGVTYQTKAPSLGEQNVVIVEPNAPIPSTTGASSAFIQAGQGGGAQTASGASVPRGISKLGTLWIEFGGGLSGN